jgi:hypothetical protein
MLGEASFWHWAIAVSVVVLAAAVVLVRRREVAGVFFGLSTMAMGLAALSDSAGLIPIYWLVLGLGILLCKLDRAPIATSSRSCGAPSLRRRIGSWAVALLVWLGLLFMMVMRYLPAETYLSLPAPVVATVRSPGLDQRALETGSAMYGDYAPALCGVALALLAAVLGARLFRDRA